MDESSEIRLLKARVALLETEKKHLIQRLTGIEKQKTDRPSLIPAESTIPIRKLFWLQHIQEIRLWGEVIRPTIQRSGFGQKCRPAFALRPANV